MPTYVSLIKYTQKGIENVKDSPKRRADAKKAAKALGMKWVQAYLVMGEYDLVTIVEAPDDETVAKFALATAGRGFISTQTLRAFNEAETDQLIASLP